MAVDNERHCLLQQSVVIILLLFSLAPIMTSFRLQGQSKEVQQQSLVNKAPVMEVRTGRILFNGTELNFNSRSSSAAKAKNVLSHVDSAQSDGTGKVSVYCWVFLYMQHAIRLVILKNQYVFSVLILAFLNS